MKRINVIHLLILNFALSISASAEPYDYLSTEVTRDVTGYPMMTHEQYIAQNPEQPFRFSLITRVSGFTDDPLPFVVIVNSTLYPQIEASIDQYLADLSVNGFGGVLYTTQGGTPANIKENILTPEWEDGAVGALLIGNLPVPWFELYEDFDNNGIPDNPYPVSFPCDLFYMDLDGVWADTNSNGQYDIHQGDWFPDIWIGQLIAYTMYGNEAEMVQNYFSKNHAFREGSLTLPDIALAYIDDDWAGGGEDWADAISQTWANTTLINDINTTAAADYMNRWDDDYQHVLLASHSSPALHSLKENYGTTWGNVYNWQIIGDDPHFFFYNLFACSNCRYSEPDYCGGAYLFNDTYGINVIGSTKTGSMLYFEDYYEPLGAGVTFGEALRQWMILHANQTGAQMWARSWFYGMANLGDPTLKVTQGVELISFEVIDDGSGITSGDGDGIPDNGETVEIVLNFINMGSSPFEDLYVLASTDDEYTTILNGAGYIPSLQPGDSVLVSGITMSFQPQTPDLHSVTVGLEIGDTGGHVWYEGFELIVRAPRIDLVSYDWREIIGNGDGILDEGETIGLTFYLNNFGGQECSEDSIGVMSTQRCIEEAVVEGPYYFPLDSVVEIEEIETRFLFFPDGHAGVAAVFSDEPSYEDIFEMFYLPGGETINISDLCEDYSTTFSYPVDPGYNSQWLLDSTLYHSPRKSFRFGSGDEYAPHSDGALELPLIRLMNDARLSFSHQYDIEEGYDGGIVEIRSDDDWQLLTPESGYPGSSVSNGSYPGGPCFNGELSVWENPLFDLSDYNGCVKIRFRFGSDGGVEGDGWYIDDITVASEVQGVVEDLAGYIPGDFELVGNHPNPFNPSTTIRFVLPHAGKVKLSVFNTVGGEVDVLEDGSLPAGSYGYIWEAEGMASGIYFYQVEFAGTSQVGKCLLLK